MKKTLVLAPVLALVLTASLSACQKKSDLGPSAEPVAAQEAAAPADANAAASEAVAAADTAADVGAVPAPKAPGPIATPPAATAPDLAYDYGYSVMTPPAMIPVLMRAHEGMCVSAGPTTCQVVGAKLDKAGKDDVSAQLVVRGEPTWLAGYRTRIEEDAKASGGKVEGATIETEDLSRDLVDLDAAMKAKIDLRDRLAVMVRTHKGRLNDLVALQERLTEVQGEIDAARSQLAVMRTRVKTAKLTISYVSMAGLAPDSAFRGVQAAGHGFLKNVMDGIGAVIWLVGYLLPFALVVGACVLVWRNRNGWRKRKAT